MIYISSKRIQLCQYETEGLTSCGPISSEIAVHILRNVNKIDLKKFFEEVRIEKTTEDFKYVNIEPLLSQSLKEVSNSKDKQEYKKRLQAIRKEHHAILDPIRDLHEEINNNIYQRAFMLLIENSTFYDVRAFLENSLQTKGKRYQESEIMEQYAKKNEGNDQILSFGDDASLSSFSIEQQIEEFLETVSSQYIKEMRTPRGIWGGDIEVEAISQILKVNIIIHLTNNRQPHNLEANTSWGTIHILYNGIHYNICDEKGNIVKEVPGDGDCLFHSCIGGTILNNIQVNTNYNTAEKLREQVCDYLQIELEQLEDKAKQQMQISLSNGSISQAEANEDYIRRYKKEHNRIRSRFEALIMQDEHDNSFTQNLPECKLRYKAEKLRARRHKKTPSQLKKQYTIKEKLHMPKPNKNVTLDQQQITTYIKDELVKFKAELGKHEDEQVIILYGNTESGKSTLLEYLKKRTLIVRGLDEFNIVVDYLSNDLGERFIAHGNESGTLRPRREIVKEPQVSQDNLVFWDLPGSFDSRGVVNEIIRAYCINEIISTAKSCKIVLIAEAAVMDKRGHGLKKLFEGLFNMFPDNPYNIDILRKMLSVIVTKTHAKGTDYGLNQIKRLIEALKKEPTTETSKEANKRRRLHDNLTKLLENNEVRFDVVPAVKEEDIGKEIEWNRIHLLDTIHATRYKSKPPVKASITEEAENLLLKLIGDVKFSLKEDFKIINSDFIKFAKKEEVNFKSLEVISSALKNFISQKLIYDKLNVELEKLVNLLPIKNTNQEIFTSIKNNVGIITGLENILKEVAGNRGNDFLQELQDSLKDSLKDALNAVNNSIKSEIHKKELKEENKKVKEAEKQRQDAENALENERREADRRIQVIENARREADRQRQDALSKRMRRLSIESSDSESRDQCTFGFGVLTHRDGTVSRVVIFQGKHVKDSVYDIDKRVYRPVLR